MKSSSYTLTIGWLYPELMNIYGDRGNITSLVKRCEWRGIKTQVLELNPDFNVSKLNECDILLIGGAQDQQQTIVNKDLKRIKKALSERIENGVPGLYVCGGFQFLGNYYKDADGTKIEGLGIFDLYTENPGENTKRLIGNIVIQPLLNLNTQSSVVNGQSVIVGFENHGGRTILGKNIHPFGKVLKGFGNNGEDGTEGAVYKNSFGTYMHGPILPKNPEFADYLLKLALKVDELKPLDNDLEAKVKKTILKKLRADV